MFLAASEFVFPYFHQATFVDETTWPNSGILLSNKERALSLISAQIKTIFLLIIYNLINAFTMA